MFLNEQKIGDNDIAMAHSQTRLFQGGGVFGPFGTGMDGDRQPWKLARQPFADAGGRACGVAIQRDDDHAIAGDMITITAHNGPSPHKAYLR